MMKKIFYSLFLLTLAVSLSNCAANSGEESPELSVPAIAADETPTTDSATITQSPPTAELVDQEPENCLSTIHGGCGGGDGGGPDLGDHAEPAQTGLHSSRQD